MIPLAPCCGNNETSAPCSRTAQITMKQKKSKRRPELPEYQMSILCCPAPLCSPLSSLLLCHRLLFLSSPPPSLQTHPPPLSFFFFFPQLFFFYLRVQTPAGKKGAVFTFLKAQTHTQRNNTFQFSMAMKRQFILWKICKMKFKKGSYL